MWVLVPISPHPIVKNINLGVVGCQDEPKERISDLEAVGKLKRAQTRRALFPWLGIQMLRLNSQEAV
jgi:hypothetical protein